MSLPDPVEKIREIHADVHAGVTLGKTEGNYHAATIHLDAEQKLCHAIMVYITAVENDGHAGFFASSDGVVWQEALRGLRLAGATYHANILLGAALRAGGEPPLDLDRRQRLLSNLAPKFDELDRQFQAKSPFGAIWRQFYAARFGQLAA